METGLKRLSKQFSSEEAYSKMKKNYPEEIIKEGKSIRYYFYRYEEFNMHILGGYDRDERLKQAVDRFSRLLKAKII